MMMFLRTGFQIFKQTIIAWLDDKAIRLGAALAFYSILSLAPFLLLVLTAASYVWGRQEAQGQLIDQMTRVTGTEGAQLIQGILTNTTEDHHLGFIASCIGFGALLFSASGMFGELQDALNIIWKVKPNDDRPFLTIIRERAFSFSMVIGSGFLLLLSLVVSTGVSVLSHYIHDRLPGAATIMQLIDFALSFGLVTFIFALTFKTVPDITVAWKYIWPGAALTAALFVVGKVMMGFYLSHTNMASSYGAAGSIVIMLVWIYYSAQILFFGAEFTHVYAERCGGYTSPKTDEKK